MLVHLEKTALEEGIPFILESPADQGEVQMIVRRPSTGERDVLEVGQLDVAEGLVGDNWKTRGSSRTEDGSAHPEMQLNIMNTRVIDLIAQEKERWALAGDQLFIDLNLSKENLPAGTRIAIGTAVIEVTAIPHTGCKKFTQRFGIEAVKFVNSEVGKQYQLRGINAKVVQAGEIRVGDIAKKL